MNAQKSIIWFYSIFFHLYATNVDICFVYDNLGEPLDLSNSKQWIHHICNELRLLIYRRLVEIFTYANVGLCELVEDKTTHYKCNSLKIITIFLENLFQM